MKKYIALAKNIFEQNKSLILFCFVTTFLIGLITHGYMYTQDSFSHDSLDEIIYPHIWKIQLGRYVAPIYTLLARGNLALPWIIGIYSLFWTSCSVFLTAKIFNLQKGIPLFLTSGIFTTNIAIIATTATYFHDLDSYAFALFLSVLSVYFWRRFKLGYLLSALCVALSLGIYQSFISVTISLIIIFSILEFLDGTEFKPVFINGLKSLVGLILGGITYFIGLKAILFITNTQQATGGYNTLDNITSMNFNELFNAAIKAYSTSVEVLTTPIYTTIISHYLPKVILAFLIIGLFYKIIITNAKIIEKISIVALLLILPFAMNIACLLSGGMSHDLMHFAIWLTYLLMLLVAFKRTCIKNDRSSSFTRSFDMSAKIICSSLIFLIISNNAILANEVYLKKNLEQDANLSFFTRVLYDMEEIDEYDNETTQVIFVGKPAIFEKSSGAYGSSDTLTGTSDEYVIGSLSQTRYKNYFNYKLNYSINIVKDEECLQLQSNEEVQAMPNYPEEGSIAIVDDKLVVKFGDTNE